MKFLYVAAAGAVDPVVFEPLAERVGAQLTAPVRKLALPAIDFAFDPARRQYRSEEVLGMLARICPADAIKLIAITGRDLFIPVLTFVFGHAQLGGRVAVVSLARLRQEFYGLPPNPEVLFDRACKETLHEAGHTFGLVHCAGHCAMALSANVQHIDRKPAAFCAACAARLARAQAAARNTFPKEQPA